MADYIPPTPPTIPTYQAGDEYKRLTGMIDTNFKSTNSIDKVGARAIEEEKRQAKKWSDAVSNGLDISLVPKDYLPDVYNSIKSSGVTLPVVPVPLTDEEKIKKQAEAQFSLEEQKATLAEKATLDNEYFQAKSSKNIVDSILKKDTKPITGAVKLLSNIPGTASYDMASKVEQLKNMLMLANRSLLKGQGQVSNFETEMLAKASANLDKGMSDEAFREELARIQRLLNRQTVKFRMLKEGYTKEQVLKYVDERKDLQI
jgi:hypothetical protein